MTGASGTGAKVGKNRLPRTCIRRQDADRKSDTVLMGAQCARTTRATVARWR